MKNMCFLASAFAGAFLTGALSTSAFAGGSLGGDCCADLEERVAELEASTVRKGNRKVSLKLSGRVNKAILFWDDGTDSGKYIVDMNTGSSQFSLSGYAKATSSLKVGYNIVFDVEQSNSNRVSQNDGDNDFKLSLEASEIYFKSGYGKLTVGLGGTASDGSSGTSFSDTGIAGGVGLADIGAGFEFRGVPGNITIGDAYSDFGGLGGGVNRVRYDSPIFSGFMVSTSWSDETDNWDAVLRYAGETESFKLAGTLAYSETDDRDRVNGSISALHTPTGLNITFAAGEDDLGDDVDRNFFYTKLGIKGNWYSIGQTALSADYAFAENANTGTGTEFTRYGVQFVQNIDAAAMELYAGWSRSELELNGDDADPIDLFVIGSRISF